ncbi:MAG: efflux RND transporter periplasmic adaptor subunit [Chloroflexi bacterium]|nr:efflux RND transporter periplasmic adaptor subunit [Chloroflexota bacterium]
MKRFVTIVVILAVVAGASWVIYNRVSVSTAAATADTTAATTTTVTKGSIELVVSSTGSLAPERQVALSFSSAGTVNSVSAVKATRVEKGQVLATLDTTDLDLSFKQAELSLTNAEAALAKASQKASEADLNAAKSSVALAQANLDEVLASPTADDLKKAEISLEQAKNSLWIAQSQRDVTRASPTANQASKAQAEVSVANADFSLQQAQMTYDDLVAGPTQSQILSAQNQLIQAQNTLDELLAQPKEEDLVSAQNQVESAKLNLDSARDKLSDAVLKAPFAGLLAEWSIAEGDIVGSSTSAGTLIDDSQYHVDISFDETEIGKLAVGQPATVTLDAYSDETLTGTVAVVDTLGTTTQGVVYYNVRVELQPTDLALRPSMTAAVDIIAQHKDSVLLVASKAIKRDTQGTYVMVQKMGGTQRANITIGITNGTLTEVTSGLNEGDVVLLNTTTTTSTNPGAAGSIMMGGFGR